MLSRRAVLALGAAGAIRLAAAPIPAGAQKTDDKAGVPYLPNATEAWMALASRIDRDTLFSEPFAMLFTVFGFASEHEASRGFQTSAEFYRTDLQAISSLREFREVSVGPLGDERIAIFDNFDPDYTSVLHVTTRVGKNVLAVQALSLSGDMTEYVAGFLAKFLPPHDDQARSLIPQISDLPIGWSFAAPPEPQDVLRRVTTPGNRPTPVATPRPSGRRGPGGL